MSRPEIPIDWEKVDDFLMAGSPGTEIAAFFSMHPNTFYDRVVQQYSMSFTEYLQEKRSKGDALLREHQYKKALGKTNKGDNTLLIWLGKDRLGQKENNNLNLDASLTVTTINYSDANNSTLQVPAETLPTANPSSSG